MYGFFMNEDKLKSCFIEVIGIDKDKVGDSLEYGSYAWDSVAHMKLIAAIEDAFDLMIETDDVIDMSSFLKAKEILRKYSIEI